MAEIAWPEPPLADHQIRLRALREADFPDLVEGCNDPLVARYTLVPSPYRESDAREWIDLSEAQRRRGEGIHFVIADRAGDELHGSVGLNRIDWEHRVGQIGYWVGPHVRRRGLAVGALRLLSGWALGPLGLGRVEARVDVENEASQGVAEACGFTREGVLRSRAEAKGRRWDEVMFSLLPADLPPLYDGA